MSRRRQIDDSLRALIRGVLEAAVRGEPPERPLPLGDDGWRLLLEAGAEHRILPALERTLRSVEAPEQVIRSLRGSAARQQLSHLRTLADLKLVADVLDGHGIGWAVAKGPAVARHWPAVDMRQYADLDVYVAPRAFPAAVDAFDDAGFAGVDRNWPEMLRQMRGEYAMRAPMGTSIDLHWDIAVRPELRNALRLDLPTMLERAERVQFGATSAPVLEAHDHVLLLAFHAAHSGANRLVWFGDVYYASRVAGFSWQRLDQLARTAAIRDTVGLVLARTARVFVLDYLPAWDDGAGTWARFVRLLDARLPAVHLPGDKHAAGGPIGSTRPTFAASVVAAVHDRRAIRQGERAMARHGRPANPLDGNAPDAQAREAYMAAVITAAQAFDDRNVYPE